MRLDGLALCAWITVFAACALCVVGGCTSPAGRLSGGGSSDSALPDDTQLIHQQASEILESQSQVPAAAKKASAAEPTRNDTDLIRFADKLKIDVWMRDRRSQLQGFPIDVETPESGTVFIPHVGNMVVTELSPETLQKNLQARFSEILMDSSVIVRRSRGEPMGSGSLVGSVRGAMSIDDAPEHIVMMGSISRPGIYSLGASLRLREALAIAGGIDDRRSSPNVFVVRGSQEKPEVIRVNINDIFTGRDMRQNILLQNQDAIFVPTKRIWKMADFVGTLLSPVISVREAIWMYDRLR